jgi:hypothetical protein
MAMLMVKRVEKATRTRFSWRLSLDNLIRPVNKRSIHPTEVADVWEKVRSHGYEIYAAVSGQSSSSRGVTRMNGQS